jgi:Carboxypeptidase regulatory-like domain
MRSTSRAGVSRFDEAWICAWAGRVLCVLAALAAVVVPMSFAPSALAAEESGQISGTVTDASTHDPIEGIDVCAQLSGEKYNVVECATTDVNGEYTLSKVPAGAYAVQFYVPHFGIGSQLDYASQYYNEKSHRSEGEAVTVTAGETTSEIDAAMQPGGKITGVVTDAVTHAPLEGIQACTGTIEEPNVGRCSDTNADGEYTLSPLGTGEYVVEFHTASFEGVPDYATQYYDGQTSARQATKVAVTTGGTTSGIDAAMQLGGIITGRVTAAATQDPIEAIRVCGWSISDESAERCPETNANGEYTLTHLPAGATAVEFGDPFASNLGYVSEFYGGKASLAEATPLSVTPGVTIAGIDVSLHAVGEETVKPPPVTETALTRGPSTMAPLLEPAPLVTLTGSRLVISGNAASVRVVCSKAACEGSTELVAQAASKRHKGRAATTRKEALVLATGSFSLAEGKDGSIMLRLTSVGRQMLAHARRHPVAAKLILSVKGEETTTKPVLAS